jgi:hypothetical protein
MGFGYTQRTNQTETPSGVSKATPLLDPPTATAHPNPDAGHDAPPELSGVQRLEKALLRDDSMGRWFFMLTFYGDDSGSAPRDRCFVLSGYLAHADQWAKIEREWTAALAEAPAIGYFKMRQCYHLDGEFAGWHQSKANKKLLSLIDVLRPYLRRGQLTEISSVLAWETFEEAITGATRQLFHNPYFFLFHSSVSEALKLTPAGQEVAFVFDEQGILQSDAVQQFNYIKATVPEGLQIKMGALSFDDDRRTTPLQIADLIAWQVRRREMNPSWDRQIRPEYKKLRNATKANILCRYNPAGLRRFCAEIDARVSALGTEPRDQ